MKKVKNIYNVPDFKADGLWVSGYGDSDESFHYNYRTVAGAAWGHMNVRTKVGGYYQKRKPTYLGTSMQFSDFQEFAEWCHSQKGYFQIDPATNERWHLDKDILFVGNKIYSAEKCCFVPSFINSLLNTGKSKTSEFLLGTYWRERFQKYVAQGSDEFGKRKHLGHFSYQMDAHRAWQYSKVNAINYQANRYLILDGSREDVYESLINRASLLLSQINHGEVTEAL